MPRRTLRRFLPQPHFIREHKSLRLLTQVLHDPNLFHLNRRSVSLAAFVSVFVGLQPVPLHMLIAAVAAVWLRCNITLAVIGVWVSNPLTFPAIVYAEYGLGARLMGIPAGGRFEMSVAWLEHSLHEIWGPLFLGSILGGLVLGSIAWGATRLLWRVLVQLRWRARRRERAGRAPHS
ncbi:MAG: DUF2062 domain-containing protein [Pseudomonadales bacterium]|jgi:uncharacterized protein (DUF2062 family)|nr:DUF2062 domain-containing protein [Pseudomonadales bacterium]